MGTDTESHWDRVIEDIARRGQNQFDAVHPWCWWQNIFVYVVGVVAMIVGLIVMFFRY